ncbi:MAG: peptidoglycan-binding domain-containing protein [Candidatus Binatia bacterium]
MRSDSERQCLDAGGEWDRYPFSGQEECFCPTGQGGCACDTTDDCLGFCIARVGESMSLLPAGDERHLQRPSSSAAAVFLHAVRRRLRANLRRPLRRRSGGDATFQKSRTQASQSSWRRFPATATCAELQQRLGEIGLLDPPADGKFGPVSRWALRVQAPGTHESRESLDAVTAAALVVWRRSSCCPSDRPTSLPGASWRPCRRVVTGSPATPTRSTSSTSRG